MHNIKKRNCEMCGETLFNRSLNARFCMDCAQMRRLHMCKQKYLMKHPKGENNAYEPTKSGKYGRPPIRHDIIEYIRTYTKLGYKPIEISKGIANTFQVTISRNTLYAYRAKFKKPEDKSEPTATVPSTTPAS